MIFIDDNNLINRNWDKNYFLSTNDTKVCQQNRVIVH